MKYVKPKKLGEYVNKRARFSIGPRYHVLCPFCGEKNIDWPDNWAKRINDGTNKCPHFIGLAKNGSFKFNKEPNIKVINNKLIVDGHEFTFTPLSILEEFDRDDELSYYTEKDMKAVSAISSSYAFGNQLNGRGRVIRKKLENLWKAF